MDTSAPRGKPPTEAAAGDGRLQRGLFGLVSGALAVGTCLHIAAAAAALVLGLSMLTIAVAGDAAVWLGLGIVVVLLVVAVMELRSVRHGH